MSFSDEIDLETFNVGGQEFGQIFELVEKEGKFLLQLKNNQVLCRSQKNQDSSDSNKTQILDQNQNCSGTNRIDENCSVTEYQNFENNQTVAEKENESYNSDSEMREISNASELDRFGPNVEIHPNSNEIVCSNGHIIESNFLNK